MGVAERLAKVDATLVKLLALVGQSASTEEKDDDKSLFAACEAKIQELEKAVKHSPSGLRDSLTPKLAVQAPTNPNLLNPADLVNSGILVAQAMGLKKVATRERMGLNEAEVSSVAGIYDRNNGNFAAISKECGADVGLLKKTPPKNSTDFAHKLLQGVYSKAGDAVTIKIGPPSAQMLMSAGKNLRKVNNVAMRGQKSASNEMNIMAAVWDKAEGNVEKVAMLTGSSLALMKKSPPTDGLDFASKLLSGAFTDVFSNADKPIGRSSMGEQGQNVGPQPQAISVEDIRNCAGKLRKVNSKVSNSSNEPFVNKDIEALDKLWSQNKGDLDVLSDICCISCVLLKVGAPQDGKTFARAMLAGKYTDGHSEALRKKFQGNAMSDALAKQSQKLKHTAFAESTCTGASENELLAVAKIYDDNNGDLQKLTDLCGILVETLLLNKPADGMDFAKKLLSGKYSTEMAAVPKDAVKRQAALCPEALAAPAGGSPAPANDAGTATTAEEARARAATGVSTESEPTDAEVAIVGRIWKANGGDLKRLFEICDIDYNVRTKIMKNPPKTAEEFARRFLRGEFTPEW